MEWVGTLGVVALLLVGMVAAGARVPGVSLAQVLGSKLLCAVALADGCGDEPVLIAAYGGEVGEMVRKYMPMLAFEEGSRAVPVDFRRCRVSSCSDMSEDGLVHRTDAGLAVTAFVHVIDCREEEADHAGAAGAHCTGPRAGNLYLQYWTYYADSATLREIPIVGGEGFHQDDWEGVQIRVRPDGRVDERASSHNGYNYALNAVNWGSDAGLDVIKDATEGFGFRADNGWGPARGLLLVSGGSHAGNAGGIAHVDRFTPGRRVHLIPLEPIAATDNSTFAISPPWEKKVWLDPEAEHTD